MCDLNPGLPGENHPLYHLRYPVVYSKLQLQFPKPILTTHVTKSFSLLLPLTDSFHCVWYDR